MPGDISALLGETGFHEIRVRFSFETAVAVKLLHLPYQLLDTVETVERI